MDTIGQVNTVSVVGVNEAPLVDCSTLQELELGIASLLPIVE